MKRSTSGIIGALWLVTVSAMFVVATYQSDTEAGGKAGKPLRQLVQTERQVYEKACASCHGMDGKGASSATLGFEIPMPDFTDCSFATREPDGDWFAVAHVGGPARGFDPLMPAFGETLSDGQISLALTYVRNFCPDDAWPRGDLNLPKPLYTEKAFPEDELVFLFGSTVKEPVSIDLEIVFEKRFGARHQVELKVPVGIKQIESTDSGTGDTHSRWGEGIGDLAVGWKGAIAHSLRLGNIFSLGGEVIFPTGDEADDLGKGIFRFEPYLAMGQMLPADVFIHLQAGGEISTDTSVAKQEIFWRAVMGQTFTQGRFGRSWTPMVEILGAAEIESGAQLEWDIVPELQISLNQRQHILACLGVRLPLTDIGPRPVAVMAYLLWDWFDGGFFEGW